MKKNFIFSPINNLKGVGPQLSKYLKKKRIEKIKDIILNLPYSDTDRSKIYKLNELEVGKIQSIKVLVKKLNFPRIRNLPNKVICEDETGKIDIVYEKLGEGNFFVEMNKEPFFNWARADRIVWKNLGRGDFSILRFEDPNYFTDKCFL